MAYYSKSELQDILQKLASEKSEYQYLKHEKSGVLFTALKQTDIADLYICGICKKSLLTSHLLNLHFAEHHDSFFEIQKDRKPSVSALFFKFD